MKYRFENCEARSKELRRVVREELPKQDSNEFTLATIFELLNLSHSDFPEIANILFDTKKMSSKGKKFYKHMARREGKIIDELIAKVKDYIALKEFEKEGVQGIDSLDVIKTDELIAVIKQFDEYLMWKDKYSNAVEKKIVILLL